MNIPNEWYHDRCLLTSRHINCLFYFKSADNILNLIYFYANIRYSFLYSNCNYCYIEGYLSLYMKNLTHYDDIGMYEYNYYVHKVEIPGKFL